MRVQSVLDAIGNTPMVELRRVVPQRVGADPGKARMGEPDRQHEGRSQPCCRVRPTGSHRIQGSGSASCQPLWEPDKVDEIEWLQAPMRRRWLGAGHTVASIMVDSAMRYLSTDLYAPDA